MPNNVKPRRYNSTHRKDAAAATRRRILESASELFQAEGYTATTVAAIAERARVATDTVYAAVGTKPALFRELIETALSGTDRPIEGRERDYAIRIQAEPDADGKLAIYADAVTTLQTRLAPLFLVLREASAAHPELGELWRHITERRARNMRELAADLIATGSVRSDLTLAEVADIIWTMNSAEYYALLVLDRSWSPDRFSRWLHDAWTRLLLDQPHTPSSR